MLSRVSANPAGGQRGFGGSGSPAGGGCAPLGGGSNEPHLLDMLGTRTRPSRRVALARAPAPARERLGRDDVLAQKLHRQPLELADFVDARNWLLRNAATLARLEQLDEALELTARPPPSTAVAGAVRGALRLRDTGAPVATAHAEGFAPALLLAGTSEQQEGLTTRSTRARARRSGFCSTHPSSKGCLAAPRRRTLRARVGTPPPLSEGHTTDAVAGMSLYFQHHGRCVANMRDRPINMDEPDQLLNLDTMSKQSTGKNVVTMHHGRFTTMPRKFVGDEATARSNGSIPSRLFLDPYHVSDGDLISYNFRMKQYQRGGQTCLAARNQYLKFEVERFGKTDPASRARSQRTSSTRGRRTVIRRSATLRGATSGPDPYADVAKHAQWLIPSTGSPEGWARRLADGTPKWSTYALTKSERASLP